MVNVECTSWLGGRTNSERRTQNAELRKGLFFVLRSSFCVLNSSARPPRSLATVGMTYDCGMSNIYAGVDLGGTSFIAVIADKKGKVLGSSDGPTTRGAKAEATIDQIAEHVRE